MVPRNSIGTRVGTILVTAFTSCALTDPGRSARTVTHGTVRYSIVQYGNSTARHRPRTILQCAHTVYGRRLPLRCTRCRRGQRTPSRTALRSGPRMTRARPPESSLRPLPPPPSPSLETRRHAPGPPRALATTKKRDGRQTAGAWGRGGGRGGGTQVMHGRSHMIIE